MRVLPAERAVIMGDDRRELQPRVMQVLVALAKARPEVISRDRLIELCWDGRIVGDDALNRCVLALRHLAQELTPQPFMIETVPRVGHRLVQSGPSAGPRQRVPRSRWMRLSVIAALLLLLAGGGFFWWWQQHRQSIGPEPASIAVLPFRNLSSGDPYFAEGVGEEILGQLSREPQFRVAGRASSKEFGADADARQVGRRLDVDYALEGSVRRQGDRVRVTANLLRTRDGIQLWSNSYDGKLDDIFGIQQRIGAAIADALERKLVRAAPVSGSLVTRGDVYRLYLTARGLLRTNDRRVGPTAVALLRDAINIDPSYAPAWASLAEATQLSGALADNEHYAKSITARVYARRAIELAPDLAEAHRAYGELFGYGSPESLAHIRRAVALDPHSAENLLSLAGALGATGDFGEQLATARRAYRLDPLWYRTIGATAVTIAEMGDRAEAESIADRAFQRNVSQKNLLLGRIAWIFGDFSEAYRRWQMIVQAQSPRWSERARISMNDAAYSVGLRTGPLVTIPQPIWTRRAWRIWADEPPSPAVWRERNSDEIRTEVYRADNLLGAKLMLNSGRAAELLATYRSPTGLLGIGAGRQVRIDQIDAAPVVALALRQAGEASEAQRILRQADSAVRNVYRKGRVPFWFEADAAAVFATEGHGEEALATLERAVARGWTHSGASDLRKIELEPAFRSLRDYPRFKSIAAKLDAHYARERAELARLLKT